VFGHLQFLLLRVDLNLNLSFCVKWKLAEVTEAIDDYSEGPNVCREGIISALFHYMAFGGSEADSAITVVQTHPML